MTALAPVPDTWPFGDLMPFRYGLIMADNPWKYKNWSAKGEGKNATAHYRCMTTEEIKALPVHMLAAPDCLLWLWCTNPMLDKGFEVMAAWGFKFCTAGHWLKKTAKGKTCFGTGYVLRGSGEPYLIGKIGSPTCTRGVRGSFEGLNRGHSRKPVEAYQNAEKLCPNVSRCELFSREDRPGWDVFGDETGKFNEGGEVVE